MKKTDIAIICIILASLAITAYVYSQLPESMATHWGVSGQVNGYMPKIWGVFSVPAIMVLLGLFFYAIPFIDPLKENIAKFRRYYDGFIILILLFLLVVQGQIILWNIGIEISPNVVMPVGLGILFFYIGIVLENAKRNWFIGIRTPWTMSSDKVWERTNKFGGKLFKAAGVISAIGVVFQDYAWLFVLVPVLFAALYSWVYSYLEYRKEKKR